MDKIVVTGGSGKLGRAVLKDLVANGYEVLNLDQTLPREAVCPTVRIDLTDFGEVVAALAGVDEHKGPFDAVVHLAAIPAPGLFGNARTFANNPVWTPLAFLGRPNPVLLQLGLEKEPAEKRSAFSIHLHK